MRWENAFLVVLCASPLASAAPNDVAAKVEAAIAQMRTSLPGDRVGKIRCPGDLSLDGGKRGQCTVPVDGRDVTLDVSADAAGHVSVNMRGKIVSLDEIEKKANAAATSGGSAETKTACAGPRVRVVVNDETIACTSSRPGWSNEWTLRAVAPDATLTTPPGFPLHPEEAVKQRLGALLAKPQRILEGADASALVQELAKAAGQPIEDVACPTKVDLSDGKSETCSSKLRGHALRVRLDVASGQWRLQPDQLILDVAELEHDAERSGAEMAKGGAIHVRCGAERLQVLDYPAKVQCDTELPGKKHRALTATIAGPDAPTKFVWGK